MKIVLASRNKKKIGEMRELLSKYCGDIEVLSLDDIGFEGDIEEDGSSFVENAVIKASVPASMGYIGVADDSGLCVDALSGAPGIFSARYSNEGSDEANNKKLIHEMRDVEDIKRGGAFVCTIACVVPDQLGCSVPYDPKLTEFASARSGRKVKAFCSVGECRGEILSSPKGNGGFGYDPLFYVPQYARTFSELSADEKNAVSHRGRAMRAFAEAFAKIKQ